ncbi:MAG: type II secretion system protein GspM [Pseudomonadota bacterium]
MSAFWRNLSDRERLMVTVGGAIVAVCLFLLLIVNPITSWRSAAADRATAAERNYAMVRQAAAKQPTTDVAADIDADTPVRIVLSQTTNQLGFSLTSINPLPDGNVSASANNVSADQLFAWIGDLQSNYGIAIVTADIARDTENPENVRAQITFGRTG